MTEDEKRLGATRPQAQRWADKMTEVLDTFAGTMQVVQGSPVGSKDKPRFDGSWPEFATGTPAVALSDVFREHVVEEQTHSWYVDYRTAQPRVFGSDYLAGNSLVTVKWTSEYRKERDDNDLWGPDDVAAWFFVDAVEYMHVVKFHAGGDLHELVLRGKKCTLDGEDVWDAYIKDGVQGAMGDLVSTFETLKSIEVFSPNLEPEH